MDTNNRLTKREKLLILGGNALTTDIVEKAKSMGIYTIVTDWNRLEDSPAKMIADEAWNISLTDIDLLSKKVKEFNIDGIFTNYTDSYLPYYVQLCNITGLPCLATLKQINTISNKDTSKELCMKHSIPVSKRYDIHSLADIDITDFSFPVLIKPVDNSGQRGIYVCNNKDDLRHYFTESIKYSARNTIMVEEYVQGDYVVMFYTIQNSNVTLSTMADKPVYGDLVNNLPKLPKGYFLPSKYVELCKKKMLPKVQSLVNDLKINNGVIGIEAVVRNNEIYVFEMQFRLGGMRHHNFVLAENKMDILAMLIRFALTGKFEGWDASKYDNANFRNHYCSLNILIKPSKISCIKGLEDVLKLPQVYAHTQMKFEGDSVMHPGTVEQIFCKLSLKDDSYDHLLDIIRYIHETIKVYDENMNNIVLKVW